MTTNLTIADRKTLRSSVTQLLSPTFNKVWQVVESKNGYAQPSDVVYATLREMLRIHKLKILHMREDTSQGVSYPVMPNSNMLGLTRRHLRSTLDTVRTSGLLKYVPLIENKEGNIPARAYLSSSYAAQMALFGYLLQGIVNAEHLYPNVREYFSYVLQPLVGIEDTYQAWDRNPSTHLLLSHLPVGNVEAAIMDAFGGASGRISNLLEQFYSVLLLSYQLDGVDNDTVMAYVYEVLEVLTPD